MVKVKGFSLNFCTASVVNFDRMKKQVRAFVKDKCSDSVVVTQPEIRRTLKHDVVTINTTKQYRVVYDKRRALNNFCSLPWGY